MNLRQKNLALASLFVLPFMGAGLASAAAPTWDASGTYDITFNYLSTDYVHEITLAQNGAGALSGNGGYPSGGPLAYSWALTSGSMSGNTIDFYANYTAPGDAVIPLTVMHVTGTVALDGSMSGTWSDNYQGGSRAGTWDTVSGSAVSIAPESTLVAEDFGVVVYDTGHGILKGYSAGFGLTNATFKDAQSVVVKLYSGATLLQTNTATALVGDTITGTQISSPFDVSGTFKYPHDGYWTNVREIQYGQSVPATRVIATVTLEDSTVVTAENTLLVGDPTTIYPDVVVVTPSPTDKDQCKKNGWKSFMDPTFKNQGQCVSHVAHIKKGHDDGDDMYDDRKENKSKKKI